MSAGSLDRERAFKAAGCVVSAVRWFLRTVFESFSPRPSTLFRALPTCGCLPAVETNARSNRPSLDAFRQFPPARPRRSWFRDRRCRCAGGKENSGGRRPVRPALHADPREAFLGHHFQDSRLYMAVIGVSFSTGWLGTAAGTSTIFFITRWKDCDSRQWHLLACLRSEMGAGRGSQESRLTDVGELRDRRPSLED